MTLFVFILQPVKSESAQQYQGLCSYVKIEILQEMTLERVGFLATLEVTNNEGDASITDFSSVLTFAGDKTGDGTLSDVSDMFFVQPPTIKGITGIDGTGIISPGQKATISWFIIPKLAAGGVTPAGVQYQIGAKLAGSIYGLEISQDVLRVLPDTITVKPDPELEITYFQPRDVDGDNPFTPDVVESAIPFTLGVMVKNVGYGRANAVKIASEQPRIVENKQGLLVVPQLIGSRVDDKPRASNSLTVDLGSIEPGKCRKGAWDMITTLSGEFTEFKASYTHDSALGGRDTSIIRDLNAYFMVHEVKNDQPGRDNLLDFLAEVTGIGDLIPDTLFESDCNTLPVNRLTNVSLLNYIGNDATVRVSADFENWVFIRLDDPAQAKFPIDKVVRSDGKVLNPNNYWTNIRYRKPDNAKLTYLNIFDFVSLGDYQYTVTYKQLTADTQPPVTTIQFNGQFEQQAGKYYVLPETSIFFIAEDESPVSIKYKLDSAPDFVPAYPFSIYGEGEHIIEYYSIDSSNNEETHKTATVVVSATAPVITNLTSDTEDIYIAGDALSVRPTEVKINIEGATTAATIQAEAEVFRGVYAWASVKGVPSSPTSNTSATIIVSGQNLDFYEYKLGAGAWSVEQAVIDPINLSGLSGTVLLSVKGRSRYGVYHDDAVVTVSWVINPAAPSTNVTNAPETPTRSTDALLNVSGVDLYRYTIDAGYYRAEAGIVQPIALTRLNEGQHAIEVIGKSGSNPWQEELNATYVSWVIDRQYGLRFPEIEKVYSENIGNLSGGVAGFVWNGKTNTGALVPPGWYTVKITLRDGLSRITSSVKLVYIGDLLADGKLLSDAGSANQREAHASGKWVVWQDQRSGNWDIYAKDLRGTNIEPVIIAGNSLNQERPRTDGEYVVWEDRQADGSWDIWTKKIGTIEPAFAITSTPDLNERKPFIDWPWVVYQKKSVSTPNAPWQLMAFNLITNAFEVVDSTTQDQLDPYIHKSRVVWQDFRDVGYGEIYMKDLETGIKKRITNNTGGQYYPVIFDQWIVWADNRNGQFDLYGYNLLRSTEARLTDTPQDETHPFINGKWVVYEDDLSGELNINLRLLHLSNLARIQLTNINSEKEKPIIDSGNLIWVDSRNITKQVMIGSLPDLQPVFNNQNTVAVTSGMVTYQQDAYTLLRLWNKQAGVVVITRYTSLLPAPVEESVTWQNNQPTGNNFILEAGSFLWVKFDSTRILDFANSDCSSLNLATGVNVFSYPCFPDNYSAFSLIRELGVGNINSVRVLSSETGRWSLVSVLNNNIVGEDFTIPRIAVIMIDVINPVNSWNPGE